MWVRLTCQHEQATSENKHMVQQSFFEYKFQKGHDIMSHITAIETMANQLNDLGAPVRDLQIITKIMCTLPPSFRHVVSAWENLDDSKKTIALLTARLLKDENMNKAYGNAETSDAAFFTQRTENRQPFMQASGSGNNFHAHRNFAYNGGSTDLDVDTVECEGILKINAWRKRENNEKMKRSGLMSRVMKWKLLEEIGIWTMHSLHSMF